MPAVDVIKNYVPTRIYKRGQRYYKSGHIVSYDVDQISSSVWGIEADVVGTSKYLVRINLEIEDGDINFYGHCTCPYDWGDVCKHQVAILYKFLTEDYQEINRRYKSGNFTVLEDLVQAVNPGQDIELAYSLKGLQTESMVNFKLTLKSEQLSDNELEQLINYVHRPHVSRSYLRRIGGYADDCDFYSLQKRLQIKDISNLEYLTKIETTSSQTQGAVLFAKDSSNFNFILNMIENNVVYLDETETRASTGDMLYPGLKVRGNENRIEIEPVQEYQIYREDDLSWTVIDGTVHPLQIQELLIREEIEIPEDGKGRFLFEILPELDKKLELQVDENLTGYDLIKLKPDINLEFDYQNQVVYCRSQVEIDNHTFMNPEILNLDLEDRQYRRSKDDPDLWFCWDTEALQQLIDFLEYYEFHVRPDAYIIRDKSDIQEFITDGFLHMPEDWEVSTTSAFDEVEIKPVELDPVVELIGEDDGSEINWFDFRITYNLGGKTYTRQELMDLLQYNKQGEAYIQVDNSYFILRETEKEEQVKNALEVAETREDGNYRSNYYNLLYYRNLIQESGIKFKGNRVYNELDRDITEDNLIKEMAVPEEINDTLRNYQKRGYYWLRFLHKYRFGGILADDMGLGKTVQTLTFLKSISPGKPALVVCPRTLIYNWGEEVEKFFPDINYLVYYGTPEEREEMRSHLEKYELVITSYSIINRDYEDLREIVFSYCIIDEAQHIKNHKTKRARAVKSINAEGRLALTGTPIENSINELWSIFDFLMQGYLENRNRFSRKYGKPIKKEDNTDKLYELKQRVAPFILRRKKDEVLQELPDKLINIHQVEMTKLQEDTYRTILDEVKQNLTETVKERGFNRSQINVLATLTRLRQVCNHPRLVLDQIDQKMTSGKLDALLEIVEEAIAGGHKIVVFSQFVQMLKLICEKFDQVQINYEYLDGSTRNRMERVKHFNKDEQVPVFLISLKAGGTGLNLTGADMVIHVDPWWNPMVERQATDRTHRIGQEKRVMVYKLITKGTVEEKMLKLQQRKKQLFENVIEDNVNPMEGITWEDIQELLDYG